MSRKKREDQPDEAVTQEQQDIDEGGDVDSPEDPLEAEKTRAETYLANWQRSQADFINFKKRTEQEKSETIKFANSLLMTELLPVLDDLERALGNVPDAMKGDAWVEGVDLIYQKILRALEGQGLSKIEAQGQDFDPNFHQAVLYEEGEEGKVIEELQKGYMLHDRLLRPSMVKVGKEPSEDDNG